MRRALYLLGDTVYEPDRGERYDMVLTNPPFGTKVQTKPRIATTSQSKPQQAAQFCTTRDEHLKPGGRAAIVCQTTASSKQSASVEILMQDCNYNGLRLPRGTFLLTAKA